MTLEPFRSLSPRATAKTLGIDYFKFEMMSRAKARVFEPSHTFWCRCSRAGWERKTERVIGGGGSFFLNGASTSPQRDVSFGPRGPRRSSALEWASRFSALVPCRGRERNRKALGSSVS